MRTGSEVDTDAGREGRRQAYLAALGVPLWSARRPLPGARPSAPLAFAPYTAAAPVPAAAPVSAPAPDAAPAPPAAPPVLATDGVPVAAPAGRGETVEAVPRLLCRVQVLAPGWSAVIMLDGVPDLAAQEYRLLANIAQALGGDPAALPPGEPLQWPLNRNPALDHGLRAMREWLAHALRLPPGRCLVFGEPLAAHVRVALPQREVIAVPRLAELLARPAAKRELWRALHG